MQTSRKLLLAALDVVGLAVNKRKKGSTLPVLDAVHINALGRVLTLTTTNLDQAIETFLQCEGDLNIVLPWKDLRAFVAGANEETVTFLSKTKNVVEVICGGQRMEALTFDPADVPPAIKLKDATVFGMSGQVFQDALRLTSYAISNDESRYVLNGICFEHWTFQPARKEDAIDFDGKKFVREIPERPMSTTMIATDGRRLATSSISLGGPVAVDINAIIPKATIYMLEKLKKRIPVEFLISHQPERSEKPDGAKTTATWPGFIRFHLTDTVITSKIIEGNYPNWRQVIPTTLKDWVEIPREKFIEAIKSTRMKGCNNDTMSFDFFNHVCELEQKIPDKGKSIGHCTFYGRMTKRLKISFNATFLQEALESLTSGRVTINFENELSPITIDSPNDWDHKIVIMPMRVS
jgi:DNA polymerase III subunit beta